MAVKSLKLIKPGNLILDSYEEPHTSLIALKLLAGMGGGSTVTFVESNLNLLVDTGFEFEIDSSIRNIEKNKNDLEQNLQRFDLRPEDIDCIFITHGHLDHYGNLDLFPDAEILSSKPLARKGIIGSKGVKDGGSIADGVKVLYTPGHTFDHASILLRTEKMRYSVNIEGAGRMLGVRELDVVIAGDAIVSPSYYAAGKGWNHNEDFVSDEIASKSIELIRNRADYIIPGHGNVFQNFLKPSTMGK